MSNNSLDELFAAALEDVEIRVASKENDLRRSLAETFEEVRVDKGLSLRELAEKMDTSLSQVQRVLHRTQGGSVTLTTLCRAAEALELQLKLEAYPPLTTLAEKASGKQDYRESTEEFRSPRQPPKSPSVIPFASKDQAEYKTAHVKNDKCRTVS